MAGVIVAAGLAASIRSAPAQGQGSGSGSADPEPPAATDEDDEDGTGSGAGAGSALLAPTDPTQRIAWLNERMAAAVIARPQLAAAKIAYVVTDLETGTELAARDPDVGMNLASNTKVLTAAAALRKLGGGFRWRTALFTGNQAIIDDQGVLTGDLYLRGRGDPTLTTSGMRQLAADLAARGITEITGKLVVDATYFDGVTEPPHFGDQPKERAAFRAPISSLAINRSAITVTVVADRAGPARIAMEPANAYAKLTKKEVTSITEGRTRLRLDFKPKSNRVELELTGQIRVGEGSWDLRRRIDDPTRYAAEVFRTLLAQEGVRIRGGLAFAQVPVTARMLVSHDSMPLVDVIRLMNKHSDNNIAETVLKTLGAESKTTPGPATWADAQTALQAELAALGVQGAPRVENGSGLYASTAVSAHQLLAVLAGAHADYRIGPDLVASLPAAGFDGTLARRMRGTPAEGRIRAKTGTLDKVISLAGYAATTQNRVLGFAIVANDIPAGQRSVVRQMMDEMAQAMVAYTAVQ